MKYGCLIRPFSESDFKNNTEIEPYDNFLHLSVSFSIFIPANQQTILFSPKLILGQWNA